MHTAIYPDDAEACECLVSKLIYLRSTRHTGVVWIPMCENTAIVMWGAFESRRELFSHWRVDFKRLLDDAISGKCDVKLATLKPSYIKILKEKYNTPAV